MTGEINKERVELARALIFIGVSDREIIRRFRDFEDFSEKKIKEQLTMLRNR